MPVIPKSSRTVLPVSGAGIGGVAPVPVDTSLESAVGQIGKTIEDIARRQQNEEDINALYGAETSYKEELIPILQGEREKQGADTNGNIERVSQSSRDIRNSLLEKASPRVRGKLNALFDRIDLSNETELSRLRSTGIKVEREQQEDRQIANSKELVLETPFRALEEMDSFQEMLNDKVEVGIYTQEEADVKSEDFANELAVTAITAIGEQQGPTAQLGLLTSGVFDEFISADQKEKFISDAQKLEKAIETQQGIDVKQLETDAKKANDIAKDKLDAQWTLDIDEGNASITDMAKSNVHTEKEIADWIVKARNAAEGKIVKTNIDAYIDLSDDFDAFTDDSNEDEINIIWDKTTDAYRKEKITRVDYDHFKTRKDNALKNADPLNDSDFKAAENRIDQFEKDGGFIPPDEDGNVILKTKATPDQKLAGRERHNVFIKRFKKWRQDNPKEDPQKWIDEQFVPAQDEVNKGIIKSTLDFMFGDIDVIGKGKFGGREQK